MENTKSLIVSTPVIQLGKGEALGITGSIRELGEWRKAIVLDSGNPPYAKAEFKTAGSFEYKFVIADPATGGIREWEEGANRTFDQQDSVSRLHNAGTETSCIRVRTDIPRLNRRGWKGAGTAIPVFSLRSEDDFGVGEFNDIRKLVDWAVMTGQSIIQLLPINDTTMTGTWEDSYPYNANSTFALHPQFIHLPDAGVVEDEEYKALQIELNSLPQVDYERTNKEKERLLRKAFALNWKKVSARKSFKEFLAGSRDWLVPYAAFRTLAAIYGTPDFSRWGKYAEYDSDAIDEFCRLNRREINFHCFVQYHLHRQMTGARAYARSRGVMLKGDLPIGISRTSVDAWRYPSLFNMNSQAGAPPDAFSADGQNWGFPTYNWEKMSEDGFRWWKSRLRKMSEYFDAFRIDHILGFFRIWEIPAGYRSGVMGHFNPALPYSADELENQGFDLSGGRYVTSPDGDATDVLFVKDSVREGYFHPRIAAQSTATYRSLDQSRKDAYNRLYDEFYYRRHNGFWKQSACFKLPDLLNSTDMLACGEDLGMIPACVPDTMREQQILSLEIQRMPKSVNETFADPGRYPYLSVCTTSTHDMNPLRAWWEEDMQLTERFFREVLHEHGEVPFFCEPWVCRRIVEQHLASPSMLTILPLQDWLAMDGNLRFRNPREERINVPAVPRYYWRYRMHLTVESLMEQDEFNRIVSEMIRRNGRG